MNSRLLIVDRDQRYREWLRHHLDALCPECTVTAADTDVLQSMRASGAGDCDLLLLAASFGASPEDPESRGLQWLREIRDLPGFPPVIALAEGGNELTAVRALQLGATDYLPKRLLTPERLGTTVKLALRRIELLADGDADGGTGDTARTPGRSTAGEDPIPGYVIRKVIGESDKAMVYLATSVARGQDVALKITRGAGEEEPEGRRLLAAEYAAISALHHPGIVDIYDYGTHAGREYLAMEYFPRGDLKLRLQRGVSECDALRYLEQIARALQALHQASILHRDLKPPNVMLRENDGIVLIDFGLARNMGSGAHSTRKGVLRGSPYYMSPEQALGEPLDPRTDLYSLGVIFYELLTGRKPYTGTSAIEVLQQHVNAPLPRLPEAQIHQQALLDGLLAKSRDERFANAAQVVEAVSGMRALRAESSAA